ncbi:hypothetical protein CIB84_009840 [Bambusicola thoracicus]|uniref:Pseudouridylate synthase PUS7L n=1 Tax=Bambusicola thoracicus TaxID=9083 RepID=A0A2P4SQR0_BAMTH|nr:hypothetical protein CIB84_009840 [Bambusicola thoracicus]
MLRSLSYVTDHTGFRGTIKKAPADFVVRELELPQRPAAPRDVSPPAGGLPAASATATASAGAGGTVGPARCDPVTYPEQSRRAAGLKSGPEAAALLDSLLGKHASERLTKFACDLKEAWDSETGCDAGAGEFSLGAVVDKRDRADLHGAIRQRFPFLVTVTKDNEMVVKGNADYRELCQLVTEKETSDFFKFLDAKLENSTFSFEPDGNKEHRKIVHHFINKKFGKILETKSFTVADVGREPNMSIIVRFRGRSCSRKRPADGFQIKQDLYTAFTLQKENLETLEAISFLAAELGVLPSDFSYTGIKDKKAITYQLMVVKKVTPERLKEIESKLEKKGMRIHNIHSAQQHLRLGQLRGNHFDIVVRDLKHHSHDSPVDLKERISEAMENIEAKGFVNYYGPQRFGQGQNVQTDQIGLALLNEKMVKAVKLFFTPEDTDDPVNNAKRYFLQTGKAT